MFEKVCVAACLLSLTTAAYEGPLAGGQPATLYLSSKAFPYQAQPSIQAQQLEIFQPRFTKTPLSPPRYIKPEFDFVPSAAKINQYTQQNEETPQQRPHFGSARAYIPFHRQNIAQKHTLAIQKPYVPPQQQEYVAQQLFVPVQGQEHASPQQYVGPQQFISPQKQEYVGPQQFISPQKQEYVGPQQFISPQKQEYVRPQQFDAPQKQEYVRPQQFGAPQKQEYVRPQQLGAPHKQEYVRPQLLSQKQEYVRPQQYVPQRQQYDERPQYITPSIDAQYTPEQKKALDRGEYVGDGDYHGEGLDEALDSENEGQQQSYRQQAAGTPSIQQYSTPAHQKVSAYLAQSQQDVRPATTKACRNYPYC